MRCEPWLPRDRRGESPDAVAARRDRDQLLAARASPHKDALARYVQAGGRIVFPERIQENAELLGERRGDQIRRENSVAAQHLVDAHSERVGAA